MTGAPPARISALSRVVGGVLSVRLISMASTMVVGIILARALGPADRGVFAVMVSVATIGSVLFTAGGDNATLRSAAAGHLHAAVRASWLRTSVSMGAAAAVVLALWLAPETSVLGMSRFETGAAVVCLPVFAANQLLGNCLLGARQTLRWSAQTLVMALGYLLIAGVVVLLHLSSPAAFMGALAASYVASVLLCSYWLREFAGARPEAVGSAAFSQTARRSAASTVAQLAFLRLQAPMLQLLSTSVAVGLLALAMPIAELLLLLPVVAGTVLIPHYTEARPSMLQVRRHSLRIAGITFGAGVLIAIASPWVIPLVYGREYSQAVPVVLALLPGVVIFAAARTVQSYLVAQGRFRAVTWGALAAIASSILGQVVLVPLLGATGAALAVSFGYATAAAPLWFELRRGT